MGVMEDGGPKFSNHVHTGGNTRKCSEDREYSNLLETNNAELMAQAQKLIEIANRADTLLEKRESQRRLQATNSASGSMHGAVILNSDGSWKRVNTGPDGGYPMEYGSTTCHRERAKVSAYGDDAAPVSFFSLFSLLWCGGCSSTKNHGRDVQSIRRRS